MAPQGVSVEKVEPLVYRVSYQGKSVVFALNDLSNVKPPAGALGADETFIGPIFDESAIRFFLVYNSRLKIFHYILDETERVADLFFPSKKSERILIGKRTGFAFYKDHRLDRKILIGAFEGNIRANNYFDGPFDQLPDNFIEGEALRSAILSVPPAAQGPDRPLRVCAGRQHPLHDRAVSAVPDDQRSRSDPRLCAEEAENSRITIAALSPTTNPVVWWRRNPSAAVPNVKLMDWTDEGIVLGARRHGEANAILEVMTRAHGRHLGLVRGGSGSRMRPVLQPGNAVRVTWRRGSMSISGIMWSKACGCAPASS
jgi:hypothetical protein